MRIHAERFGEIRMLLVGVLGAFAEEVSATSFKAAMFLSYRQAITTADGTNLGSNPNVRLVRRRERIGIEATADYVVAENVILRCLPDRTHAPCGGTAIAKRNGERIVSVTR